MKSATLKLGLSLFAAGFLLSACDGDGGDGGNDGGGNPQAACSESFGADFTSAFNRSKTDEPVDAQSVSLTPTPTAEPCNPA